MNNNLLTGVNLKVFYSSDVGNSSPSSSLLKQVNEIAAFPAVAVQNQAAKIETYDNDYASVLMGDKSIDAFPITVNLIPDDISHQYLTQAADNQSVLQVKVQYEEAEDQEAFILLNGYISSYSDSGDKDSVVMRSFIFTPETLVAQGIADVQPVLRQGDFGVGSNGVDTPQYQLPMAGNGFIQIPGASSDNPASANLIGVGLTNQGRESGFVISESGDLKLYARNSSTAWTRIYTSTEQDLRYVQRTVKVNGYALTGNIDLVKGDVGLGNVTNDAQLKTSSNLSDLNNVVTAKKNLGLDKVLNVASYSKTELDSTFVPKTLKVNGHELNTDIVLQPDDIGSYSKTESDSKFVPKNLKVNGHELSTDIDLQPSDIGTIPVANGGTGAITVSSARTALGLGVSNDVTHRNLALINSGSDAIVSLNGSIIRGNSNNALIIGSSGGFFIRPKGDGIASPQLSFDANGVFDLTATNVNVGGTVSTTGNVSIGGTLSARNSLTLSSTGDAIADINGFKLRATPAGVTVISTPNQAINIRPKGDTDLSKTVIINPADSKVSLNGMSLAVDGTGSFGGSFGAKGISAGVDGITNEGVLAQTKYAQFHDYVDFKKDINVIGIGAIGGYFSCGGLTSRNEVIAHNPTPNSSGWANSGFVVARMARGALSDTAGSFFKMYLQENIGTEHYGILNVNGFGKDLNWFFKSSGVTDSPIGTLQVAGSDIRLKENIVDADDKHQERIAKIGITEFKFRSKEHTQRGFIAQQMATVDELYTFKGGKNIDESGEEFEILNVDQIAVLADVISTVQDLMNEIAVLKYEISVLKTK
ncbi:tail fiber domain-containing protein [Serratia proteamaculans]|uniref:tail fiber domain-containing protein n=1 Tax=Serratia proteamaculans TaxID=28151 RepID=UPI0039AEAA68